MNTDLARSSSISVVVFNCERRACAGSVAIQIRVAVMAASCRLRAMSFVARKPALCWSLIAATGVDCSPLASEQYSQLRGHSDEAGPARYDRDPRRTGRDHRAAG